MEQNITIENHFQKLIIRSLDYVVDIGDIDIDENKNSLPVNYKYGKQKSTGSILIVREMKYNSNSLQEHCKFIQILSRNDIPFLIPFVGFTARQPYMVMLKCVADKSLHQILHGKKQNNITGDQKNSIATCVAYAISNLHQNNIVYNDIDSHNIIFDDNNIAYLYEFESSIQLDIDPQLSPPLISNNPAYIAPEVFKSNTYTTKSDVYSFGVLLWELETESIPYEGIAREQISEALKKEERLPIPQTAPPSLKKLIKKCWEQNPEKRPDFNKILEMFLTMQVSFNNSKVETIDSINKTYNSWKNNIPKIGFDNVIDLFRSLDTQKILSYTKIIDYDMSKPFIESVMYLFMNESSIQILQIALFELLRLITSNQKCLNLFIEMNYIKQLPILMEELQDISLSILIPIFKYRRSCITNELMQTLCSLIGIKTLKILRLFSIYLDEPEEGISSIQLQIIDLLIMRSEIFIKNGAGRVLIQTLYKLIQTFPWFYKSRGQYCLNIFVQCLSSQSFELVETTYSTLYALNNYQIKVPNAILLEHIKDESKRDFAIKFLIISFPDKLTIELMKEVFNNYEKSNFAIVAFLHQCQSEDIDESFTEFLNNFLTNNTINIEYRFQAFLLLMKNNSFCVFIPELTNAFELFTDLISEDNQKVLIILFNIIQKLEITEDTVYLMENSMFLNKYLNAVIKLNEDKYYLNAYVLIDQLGRVAFSNEYLLLMEPSIKHLKTKSALQYCALSYYALISNYLEAMPALIEYDIIQEINATEILEQNYQCASTALANIQEQCRLSSESSMEYFDI